VYLYGQAIEREIELRAHYGGRRAQQRCEQSCLRHGMHLSLAFFVDL
jgi:hypothetical protein